MGVCAMPGLVRRTEETLEHVKLGDILYSVANFIYKEEWRNSLISLCPFPVDLSFFIKIDSSCYGDETDVNTSFTPDEVLNCIKGIEYVFREKEDQFIGAYQYKGVYDDSNHKINEVFIESNSHKLFPFFHRKRIYHGYIHAFDNVCFCCVTMPENFLDIDLTQKKFVMYYVEEGPDNQPRKGKKINWHIEKIKVYNQLKPELDSLTALAIYAKEHNLELQMVLC